MIKKFSEVERDAMALSREERTMLAKHLLATLEPGDDEADLAEVEHLWLQEAERRYAEYKAGKRGARPAEEVFEEIRRSLQ